MLCLGAGWVLHSDVQADLIGWKVTRTYMGGWLLLSAGGFVLLLTLPRLSWFWWIGGHLLSSLIFGGTICGFVHHNIPMPQRLMTIYLGNIEILRKETNSIIAGDSYFSLLLPWSLLIKHVCPIVFLYLHVYTLSLTAKEKSWTKALNVTIVLITWIITLLGIVFPVIFGGLKPDSAAYKNLEMWPKKIRTKDMHSVNWKFAECMSWEHQGRLRPFDEDVILRTYASVLPAE